MNITELYIPAGHPNRPGDTLTPIGVVIHRTGRDVGARWLREYFSRDPDGVIATGRYGSSQYGVDDAGAFAYMPESEVAWHCSGDVPAHNQNEKRIGIETCQYFDDPARIRPKTYANLVALGAEICARYGWAPRDAAEDGAPRFTRHQDWDPVNRPNDPGDFLRWDDYLTDVEIAILGAPWRPKEGAITVNDILAKIDALGQSLTVWLARLQRGLDIETGRPFDPQIPPIDSRIVVK